MKQRVLYSREQKSIIDLAGPPNQIPSHPLIRVTAAAGTGKTTTLIGYSERLIELNHSRITYVTFSKSAAADAAKRLGHQVRCSTIHAIALGLLELDEDMKPDDDSKLDEYIFEKYHDDITEMLSKVIIETRNNQRSNKNPIPRYMRNVSFYIRKTLSRFLQSADSIEKGFDPDNKYNTYYPATKWHQYSNIRGLPRSPGGFYVKIAAKVYKDICSGKLRLIPFDMMIKKAHIEGLYIPCDVLLVDESQDCTACQIDWLQCQKQNGTQIVFVGDACQTIYGFRGAKSRHLMEVKGCVDRSLTRSYRFGKEIASIANTILFIKENSPQTPGPLDYTKSSWIPYRVKGKSKNMGFVDSKSSMFPDKEQTTIIGRTNIGLMARCLTLILDDPNVKIALIGKGSSGTNKWNKTFKEIKDLFKLFMGKIDSLDHWPLFRYDNITNWDDFISVKNARDLGTFTLHIAFVMKYGEDTLQILKKIKRNILDKKYSEGEAMYLLTTVHAAKGLEWDNVQVLDDFIDLARYKKKTSTYGGNTDYEFDQKNWGDDLNLWYVAVTRARRCLCLPEKFTKLASSLKLTLMYGVSPGTIDEDDIESMIVFLGDKSGFPECLTDLTALYRSLLREWGKEVGDQCASVLDLDKLRHNDEDTSKSIISDEENGYSDNETIHIVTQEIVESSRKKGTKRKRSRRTSSHAHSMQLRPRIIAKCS